MAFLHTQSCECMKSELLLFEIPPTQTTIEGSHWVQYKPISSMSGDSPLEFTVPGNGDEYIDLAHTMLSLKIELKSNVEESKYPPGVTAAKVDKVGPVNNFLHSLFSQIDVSLNHTSISPSTGLYPYRSYIETLLNYGPAAKNSHLSCVLWSDDTAGNMDDINDDQNEGLVNRRNLLVNRKIDMIGHLHHDILNQDRLLLNGVEVYIRLVRSPDKFCLMDPFGYFSVHIEEASLMVRRVKISPGVLLAHSKALSQNTAKYPITRVQVKAVTLQNNIHAQSIDNICLGQLPKRIIVGFVRNKAFSGDFLLNPYNFEHFNINFLCLYIDGVQIPSKPLQPDFNSNMGYVEAYHTLFSGTGIHFLNEGNNITRESYPDGYCLFAFDLTPDLSANECSHWNLIKHGSIRIEVRFAEPLTYSVNCIVYSEHENILEIDASRQIIVDFTN